MIREIDFENGFQGVLKLENGTVAIGEKEGGAMPYELLFGALASCLYSTFLGIMEEHRQPIAACRFLIDGEKREQVPTTLRQVHLTVTMSGIGDEETARELFKQATERCSMFETVRQVAQMSWELHFDPLG